MGLNVEANQIRSQQAIDQFSLPRTDSKRFRVRPWYMPEDRNPRVRTRLLDHPGQEREMIILGQEYGTLQPFHFFQHRVGEASIRSLIMFPVGDTKQRAGVRDVAEGPKTFIGKSVVVTFLFFFANPDSAQGVAGIVRRNAQAVTLVHRFAIRIATAVGYPGSVAGAQNRFERGYESAGGNDGLDILALPSMDVGFAIGNDKQAAVAKQRPHLDQKARARVCR